ncbi:MAG: hypothetical protein U5J83_14910, partial [Bryobacterales bacterium]|nr:hypothetical protein [Bryobacterales bacterium]
VSVQGMPDSKSGRVIALCDFDALVDAGVLRVVRRQEHELRYRRRYRRTGADHGKRGRSHSRET